MNANGPVGVRVQQPRESRTGLLSEEDRAMLAEEIRTQVRARIERDLPRLIRARVMRRLD